MPKICLQMQKRSLGFTVPSQKKKNHFLSNLENFGQWPGISLRFHTLDLSAGRSQSGPAPENRAAKITVPPPLQSEPAVLNLYIERSLKLTFAYQNYCFCVIFPIV